MDNWLITHLTISQEYYEEIYLINFEWTFSITNSRTGITGQLLVEASDNLNTREGYNENVRISLNHANSLETLKLYELV